MIFIMILELIFLIITVCASIAGIILFKLGKNIKGGYTIGSSIDCEDTFISRIVLENFKDRSVVIYGIFFRMGVNNYIQLEEFKNEPLILEPFGCYVKEYLPIDFYDCNLVRINYDNLLKDWKVKKNIVLSTSQGRVVVQLRSTYWTPLTEFHKNRKPILCRIVRTTYEGISYGLNIKYILKIEHVPGKYNFFPINLDEYKFNTFELKLSQESLESKDNLENFLKVAIRDGLLGCRNIEVIDINRAREEKYSPFDFKTRYDPVQYNWFQYYLSMPLLIKFRRYFGRGNTYLF